MDQDGVFSYSENGFTIQLNNGARYVAWDEIEMIRAYKIDQLTLDCIVIEVSTKENIYSINDDTSGYIKFMDLALKKLPEFKKDWFEKVAFPAFATNPTIIYERVSIP
ncbi:MAG TPA: hypothetical protein VK622_04910 [Puia sp.]|nr:hypothetical protein [Puia sp.]